MIQTWSNLSSFSGSQIYLFVPEDYVIICLFFLFYVFSRKKFFYKKKKRGSHFVYAGRIGTRFRNYLSGIKSSNESFALSIVPNISQVWLLTIFSWTLKFKHYPHTPFIGLWIFRIPQILLDHLNSCHFLAL